MRPQARFWFISCAGFSSLEVPTTTAGTPATVVCGGTSWRTTLPAPILAPVPISTRPKILAPAPMRTPERTTGWRLPSCLPVPPRVTSWRSDTLSSTMAVSPMTTLVAWSSMMPQPTCAPGWMSTPKTSLVMLWK